VNKQLSNKKILLTLAGNAVDIFIGFGTVMLVTRTFSEESAGKWFLFVNIFALLNSLRDGFIQNGLIKYVQTDDLDGKLSVYKTSLIVTTIFEVTTCFIVVSLFQFFNWFDLAYLFQYYPFYSIPYAIYRWTFVVHRSQLNVVRNVIMNSGFLVVLVAGTTYIHLANLSLSALVVVLGLSSVAAILIGMGSLDMRGILAKDFDPVIVKKIIRYGKHGLLRELTGTISTRISLFITASLLSYSQTAFLGVSQRYLTLLLIPNSAFQSLLYPVLVRVSYTNDPLKIKNTYEYQVSKLLAAMLVLATCITLVSPLVITVIHGQDYQPAIGLLIIGIWTIALFSPFGSAFGSIINTIGKPRINSVIVMVNSFINVTVSYFLISWLGLYGAVLGPLFTELIGFLWARQIIAKNTAIDYNNVLAMIPRHYKSLYNKLKISIAS